MFFLLIFAKEKKDIYLLYIYRIDIYIKLLYIVRGNVIDHFLPPKLVHQCVSHSIPLTVWCVINISHQEVKSVLPSTNLNEPCNYLNQCGMSDTMWFLRLSPKSQWSFLSSLSLSFIFLSLISPELSALRVRTHTVLEETPATCRDYVWPLGSQPWPPSANSPHQLSDRWMCALLDNMSPQSLHFLTKAPDRQATPAVV